MSIVSALGHEPDVIILDEPVASLDPVARRLFLRELVTITDDRDCTIIFSTHIVSDLERVASRVWVLKDGVIAIDEPLDSLKEGLARIYLSQGIELPGEFRNDLVHQHHDENTQLLVLRNWNDQRHHELERAIGTQLEPEWWLSLEDIFLEVHA